jgi:hypothetical protein
LAFSLSVSVSFIIALKQLGQVRLASFSWISHHCFGDNFIVVTKVGRGTLVCCGKEMEKFVSEQYHSTARDLLGGDGD